MNYLLTLAVLPGLFLIVYIYNLDKKEKEPIDLLVKLTGLGAATVISAYILEMIGGKLLGTFLPADSIRYTLANCFIVIAMSEEGGKYFVMKKFAWTNKNFDYMFDGIVYGVCVGLGFAIVENISYVFQFGAANAISRAITAIPGHATFGIYMGWYMSCAKYYMCRGDQAKADKYLKKSFVVPVLLHGFYDFCLFASSTVWMLIFYIFIAVLYYRTFKMIKRLAAADKPIDNSAQTNFRFGSFYQSEGSQTPTDRDYFE